MAGNMDTIDAMIASAQSNGMWRRTWLGWDASTGTDGTTGSGYIGGVRFAQTIAGPSVGGGMAGMFLTYCRMMPHGGASTRSFAMFCVLEYVLGTLTVSGNTYADGVAMPASKRVAGVTGGLQVCADFVTLDCNVAVTATTPTVTVTYKNERGTAGRTASIVLPTSPGLRSQFLVYPHLQAGDTGIQDVSGMSISAGSAGSIRAMGCLVLGMGMCGGPGSQNDSVSPGDMVALGLPIYLVESGDTIAFYKFGSLNMSGAHVAHLAGIAEST